MPAVEPGILPGGKDATHTGALEPLKRQNILNIRSGRQDAALYVRQGCPTLLFQWASTEVVAALTGALEAD